MYYYSLSSSTSQEIDLIYCQCSVWIGNYSFRKYCSFRFLVHIFTKHPERSWPPSTDVKRNLDSAHCHTGSYNTSLRFPLLPHAVPPVPSTCRLPLCRWERHSLRQRLSAPDASENVRWGPASQSASVGGPSWWCLPVPGCRPRPPQRSVSPWDQRGLGCGRPLGRLGTARRDSVEVGMGVGLSHSLFRLRPPLGSSRRTCSASWSPGCLVRLRRRRGACDTRAASRRCEGESGSGFVMKVVGHWGCWTLRWKGPDYLSCCPGDRNKEETEQTMTSWIVFSWASGN